MPYAVATDQICSRKPPANATAATDPKSATPSRTAPLLGGGEAGDSDGVSLTADPESDGEMLGEAAGGDDAGGVALAVGAGVGAADGGDDTFGGDAEWDGGAAAGAEVGAIDLLGAEDGGKLLGEAAGAVAGG